MRDDLHKIQEIGQKVTREALTRAAYRYLERFASTEAQLTKVLAARIDRELGFSAAPELISAARSLAGEISRRCAELGLVNDRLYGETNARRLLARGKPLSAIRAALKAKGVGREDIDAALAKLAEDNEGADLDFAAAVAYARRRRLGPFRRKGIEGEEIDDTRQRKEYAAMARAGFGYDLSRRVLRAESADELED